MGNQEQIEEMVKLDIEESISGYSAFINDMRISKSKPFSVSKTVMSFDCPKKYILSAIGIPEGTVVLTDKELNEELDTIKCAMIVHDDDGEKYVSLDDYNEYTERLGKIARQRKVRIEQLEKLLDDRCDRCIERERKETAEKFAEMAKELLDKQEKGWSANMIWIITAKNCIDEICKELTEGKV